MLRQTLEVLRELQLTPATRPDPLDPDPLTVALNAFMADEQQHGTKAADLTEPQPTGRHID